MEEHRIDIKEETEDKYYGHFVDIESLEVIKVPLPKTKVSPKIKKTNEYMKPSLVHSIYAILMFVLKRIHEL